ncbi:hypothetical protein HZF05_00270 [Sphingomonas sp. CGMCC 1.13654]|uniref:Inner membrane protein n=1 Tax=Sphingomonas chungangi TaxID=2683589 RepID=A0A838L1I6_9SPHN|nr:hypothetical protein [Sphingomonas chungangi]MBA2932515.1 hypothetical protein [Sphingomonas chungangi]MVW56138.1 hypothetical protein [Sphingomonas chungangi]
MESDYDLEERRSRTWLWVLIGLLIAFAGGMGAMGYAVTHDARTAGLLHLEPIAQAQAEKAQATHAVVQQARQIITRQAAVTPPTPSQAQMATRVATLEDKVDDIQAQATEATGDASRAEGLLVAFAARRALDRGVELGYIEGLLRQRFGGTQPQAVATILSAAHQPVTLADLQNGLDAIAPTLAAGGSPKTSWWQSFRNELSGMVVVRRAGEPSAQPADRVTRAQRMLEAGQVDTALAEIVRLSDHSAADGWIVAARRYLAGRGALDQIETAALLDPATSAGAPRPAPAQTQAPVKVPGVASVHPATAKATD